MAKRKNPLLPIPYWSYSSLMAYLRNPLAWYKRYVEKVYDMPSSPSSIVGRAGHTALQHFYGGIEKAGAIALGLEYLRNVPDFEINFGKAKSNTARRKKRKDMEKEYLQAINFYLERPPRHKVVAVETSSIARVDGLPLPIRAISDLVVESRGNPGALDIVDHKFVDSYSALKAGKSLFVLQALFNYYTVRQLYSKPVKRFLIYECKKTKNRDGKPQVRKYTINYDECKEDVVVLHRLITDATKDLETKKNYLPNPSDLFEGENSFDIYRMGLLEET